MNSKVIVELEYWGVVQKTGTAVVAWPEYTVGKRTITSSPMPESDVDKWVMKIVADPQLVTKQTIWRQENDL